MAEARDRAAWNRTFGVMAQIYNSNRDPDKHDPIDPMRFFPWDRPDQVSQPAEGPTAAEREMLKTVFSGKGKK